MEKSAIDKLRGLLGAGAGLAAGIPLAAPLFRKEEVSPTETVLRSLGAVALPVLGGIAAHKLITPGLRPLSKIRARVEMGGEMKKLPLSIVAKELYGLSPAQVKKLKQIHDELRSAQLKKVMESFYDIRPTLMRELVRRAKGF